MHPQYTHIKDTPKFKQLINMEAYFQNNIKSKYRNADYNTFSIIDKKDEDRLKNVPFLLQIFNQYEQNGGKSPMNVQQLKLDSKVQRAIGVMLGLAIGDALGSCTEFEAFEKNRKKPLIAYDFKDVESQNLGREGANNIWTDDCSMALSLADSLLLNQFKHQPKHVRFMYHMWLHHGLNNGGRPYSIGLGGNISISTREFQKQQQDYTEQGNQFNNGNGSLMRLAPIPVTFFRDEKLAMQSANNESRTTHNGLEAKQCCRLFTLIIVRLINRGKQDWKSIINKACVQFTTNCSSVKHLALSEPEPQSLYDFQTQNYKNFVLFNKKLSDRNWNWKDPNFTYSPSRADSMPGYVGSYCMDALSMALHTAWFGNNFHEIVLKNANMGGDCDTVGAIAGQIAGAIYGIDSGMLHLYRQMQDTKSGRFEVFLKAYKLALRKKICI